MDYKRIHDQIIERAKNRVLEGYSEKHHIVPKCIGGGNEKDNIVKLTAREHFIVHKLLCEIYPNESKLHYAAWMMTSTNSSKNRTYNVSSKEYERLRENFSKSHSETIKGENNPFYGKLHTNETKEKISQTKKNTNLTGENNPFYGKTHSEKTKRILSELGKGRIGDNNPFYGKTHSTEFKEYLSLLAKERSGVNSYWYGKERSDETKKKLSNANKGKSMSKSAKEKLKGRKCIYDINGQNKYVKEEELDNYLSEGWTLGRYKK
jgi:hypothetical protein